MFRPLVFALLTAVLVPAQPAWAGKNYIAGVVKDRNNQPVVRAQVKLVPELTTKGTFLMVTDAQGRFLVDYLRTDDGLRTHLAKKSKYKLEIFKPGYHIDTREFFYKRGDVTLDPITLVEDTVRIDEGSLDLADNLQRTDAQNGGGSYEGQ